MDAQFFANPHTAASITDPTDHAPLSFHRRLPGYATTPITAAPHVASLLGVGQVWVKDESARLGLPAFKILGASWAIYQALAEKLGWPFGPWQTLEQLGAQLEPLRPLTLAAATDGNHGRAVARVARWLGLGAQIFVPANMAPARIQAIEQEGARVTVVDGSYDDAVALSASTADARCLVISDTAWPGYEQIPRWVIEGYGTIFHEADAQLSALGARQPDLIAVQMGVGALAAAVVRHYRHGPTPTIIGVEPSSAACVLESMRAGRLVEVPGPHSSIMAGLNCGMASPVAWPIISAGINLFMAVDDERARQAMRALASDQIVAGETGAAGVAGLIELLCGPQAPTQRDALGIGPETRILVFATEGATDPAAYTQIVGQAGPGTDG